MDNEQKWTEGKKSFNHGTGKMEGRRQEKNSMNEGTKITAEKAEQMLK